MYKEKLCNRGNHRTRAQLVRNITTSGINQIYWFCGICKGSIDSPTIYLKHDLVKNYVDPDTLPVIENYSGTELCAVCHSPYAEFHHWAPKHLFGAEADLWPGTYLCHKCHMRWHALVTPSMALQRGVMHDEHLQTIGK